MALTFRRWGPDSCECKVFYQFDDELPSSQVVFSYISQANAHALAVVIWAATGQPSKPQPSEVICSAHLTLTGTALYSALVRETHTLNIARSIAHAMNPTLEPEDFTWSYDANRLLLVQPRPAAAVLVDTAALQAAWDIQFGPGIVQVV